MKPDIQDKGDLDNKNSADGFNVSLKGGFFSNQKLKEDTEIEEYEVDQVTIL